MTIQIKFLSLEEINLVLTGLGKLPLEESLEVWARVKEQAENQINQGREEPSNG